MGIEPAEVTEPPEMLAAFDQAEEPSLESDLSAEEIGGKVGRRARTE